MIVFSTRLHAFGLIFCSGALFSETRPDKERMRYYLFMFHGWLSIDKIEYCWDEQGKNCSWNPFYEHHTVFFPCQSMCECATINSHCIYEYVVCCLPMVWWWLFSSFLHCPMAALKPQFQRDEMPTTLSISIITRAHTTWFNSFFGCLFTMYHSFYVDFSWIFTLKSGFCCSVQQFQLDRKKNCPAQNISQV